MNEVKWMSWGLLIWIVIFPTPLVIAIWWASIDALLSGDWDGLLPLAFAVIYTGLFGALAVDTIKGIKESK